jgi:hypothetical protein
MVRYWHWQRRLLLKAIAVNGSTTSPDKLATLQAEGIVPFMIDLSVDNTTLNSDFFTCDVMVIAIPPKSRSGEGAEYVHKLQRVIDAVHQHQIKKGYPSSVLQGCILSKIKN